jgi:DNA-binding NtrC family response regulator
LLLEDVSALTLEDQRRLYGWLDASSRWMQVVSITSRSLLPSIQEGAFLEMLYYRLNIICGEVARGAARPHVRL